MNIDIELLPSRADRRTFACGRRELDAYLAEQAGQDMRRNYAAVFVARESGRPAHIAGYYTLSSATVELAALPESERRGLPRYPHIPAILLGRLAVDMRCQGQGVGTFLLIDAIRRILGYQLGWVFLIVSAKDESTRGFYKKRGFQPFFSEKLFLWLERRRAAAWLPEA